MASSRRANVTARKRATGNPRPTRHAESVMTFVVTNNCIKCKYTDCVEVCPVDCFHEGPNFLVIDPAECIDCTLCEPECPAHAIYAEDDVPEDQKHFLAINAELSERSEEHTSELQSLLRISYAVFCLKKK